MIRRTDNQFNNDQFLYDGHDFDPEVGLQYNKRRLLRPC